MNLYRFAPPLVAIPIVWDATLPFALVWTLVWTCALVCLRYWMRRIRGVAQQRSVNASDVVLTASQPGGLGRHASHRVAPPRPIVAVAAPPDGDISVSPRGSPRRRRAASGESDAASKQPQSPARVQERYSSPIKLRLKKGVKPPTLNAQGSLCWGGVVSVETWSDDSKRRSDESPSPRSLRRASPAAAVPRCGAIGCGALPILDERGVAKEYCFLHFSDEFAASLRTARSAAPAVLSPWQRVRTAQLQRVEEHEHKRDALIAKVREEEAERERVRRDAEARLQAEADRIQAESVRRKQAEAVRKQEEADAAVRAKARAQADAAQQQQAAADAAAQAQAQAQARADAAQAAQVAQAVPQWLQFVAAGMRAAATYKEPKGRKNQPRFIEIYGEMNGLKPARAVRAFEDALSKRDPASTDVCLFAIPVKKALSEVAPTDTAGSATVISSVASYFIKGPLFFCLLIYSFVCSFILLFAHFLRHFLRRVILY